MSCIKHRQHRGPSGRLRLLALLAVSSLSLLASPAGPLTYADSNCLQREVRLLSDETYRTVGHFTRASEAQQRAMSEDYLKKGVVQEFGPGMERAQKKDLAIDLNDLKPSAISRLVAKWRYRLAQYCYVTSGAGLASRVGGVVPKALVPVNLKTLLRPQEFAAVLRAMEIVDSGTPQKILELSGRKLQAGENARNVATEIVGQQRKLIGDLIAKAQAHPDALTPLDIKFTNAAIQSKKAGAYIPFDVATNGEAHVSIWEYVVRLKRNYRQKRFHPDDIIDRRIKDTLGEYFRESDRLGETHVFGYQVGYHPMDPKTGKPLLNEPAIGEGAGMLKSYLDESGRTAQLRAMGKKYMIFENIDVFADMAVANAAYSEAGKPVGAIVVPFKPNHVGGFPFIRKRADGSGSFEIHEQTSIPREYWKGNHYFNTGTTIQELDLAPPRSIGYEPKTASNGVDPIIRPKISSGAITQEVPTAGIGGRSRKDFEMLKTFQDFGQNGGMLIRNQWENWSREFRGP